MMSTRTIFSINKSRLGIRKTGFTMIELLVVVSLSVLLMLATSTLFLSFLLGRTKVSAIKEVQDEGQYAISRMEFLIRNAIEVLPNGFYATGCEPNMDIISFRSLDGGVTSFFAEEDSDGDLKIASNSGVYLTSGNVELVEGPIFNCTQPADGTTQHVEITFTLRKGTPNTGDIREFAEREFKTGVSVRSL